MKLKNKFMIRMILVILIVLIISGVHVAYVFQHVHSDIRNYQHRMADMYIKILVERLHSDTDYLTSIASFFERQNSGYWNTEEAAQIINDFERESNFALIGFANKEGILFKDPGRPIDISKRNYFKLALKGRTSLESIVEGEKDNKICMLNIGIPVRMEGEVKGVVVGSYSMDELAHLLPEDVQDIEIRSFIVRNDGAIIIDGSEKKRFQNIENLWEFEGCDIDADNYLKIFNAVTNNVNTTAKYKFDGEKHHVIVAPIKFTSTYARTDFVRWNLVIDIPTHFIWSKAFEMLLETAGYTLLLLGILGVLAFRYYHEKEKAYQQTVKKLGESEKAYLCQTEQLQKMKIVSQTDAVTGGLNRIGLEQKYEKTIRIAQAMTVILIDLDNFKQVNDRFGHAVGDIVIKNFSCLLEQIVGKEGGFVGRIGGDEFVLCIPNLSKSDTENLTNQIKTEFALEFSEYSKTCNLGTTMGVAYMPKHGKELYDLLQYADEALYQGKRTKKGSAIIAE